VETGTNVDGRYRPDGAAMPQMTGRDDAPGSVHRYSSAQVDLPLGFARTVRSMAAAIPAQDLALDGREAEPHITIRWGLHTAHATQVRALLADEPPITARFGKTSIFPNSESEGGDVVKIDVVSLGLHRLNRKLKRLAHTDTHPGYVPHCTVAFVKPGRGMQYAGDARLAGKTVTIGAVRFSGKDGEVEDIPLTGAPRVAARA
jgi:2'-5' RNA ligase